MSDETIPPPLARRSTDLPTDAPWWARWFVANANEAWRWFSVQIPLWCGGAAALWPMYGDEIIAHVPQSWISYIVAGGFWLTMGSRLVNQKKNPKEQPDPEKTMPPRAP